MSMERVPYSSYMAYTKKICCMPLAECYGKPFKADRWVTTYKERLVLVTSRMYSELTGSFVGLQPIIPVTTSSVATGNTQIYMINGKSYVKDGSSLYVGFYIPESAYLVSLQECKAAVEKPMGLYFHNVTTIEWLTHNGLQIRLFRDSEGSEKMQLFFLEEDSSVSFYLFSDLTELDELQGPGAQLSQPLQHQIGLF